MQLQQAAAKRNLSTDGCAPAQSPLCGGGAPIAPSFARRGARARWIRGSWSIYSRPDRGESAVDRDGATGGGAGDLIT